MAAPARARHLDESQRSAFDAASAPTWNRGSRLSAKFAPYGDSNFTSADKANLLGSGLVNIDLPWSWEVLRDMRRFLLLAVAFAAVLTVGISRADRTPTPGRTRKAAGPSRTSVQRVAPLDYDACVAWVKATVEAPVYPGATGAVVDLQAFFHPEIQGGTGQIPKLMLFGGRDHKVFLGCLNCGSSERESIWNKDGPHGPGFVASESIWKRFSDYGSEYGAFSPWASVAREPPVIVDQAGRYYGHFTVSTFDAERTHHSGARFILDIVQAVRAAQ